MQLAPWRTLAEVTSRATELEDLWDRCFGMSLPFMRGTRPWQPTVDVSETAESIVVKAEIPGIEPDQIHVDVTGGVLTIKGEKKGDVEEKDAQHYYRERYSGTFHRAIQLPGPVQVEKSDASFEKGVVTITLPKAKEAKATKIEVKRKK